MAGGREGSRLHRLNAIPGDNSLVGLHSLHTDGGVNLNGARTLDEYIAQKYGSQPAAPTATEAEAPTSNAAPDAETPVSDASPAAEPAASSDTEDAAPALERTVKSERIQKQKESRFVRELGELFGIPEGERRDNLRQLTTQLADQRRTTARAIIANTEGRKQPNGKEIPQRAKSSAGRGLHHRRDYPFV